MSERKNERTELQKKAVEIAEGYMGLRLLEKINVIAKAFGCTSGRIVTSPCRGKWRGTSDISICFDNDNGASLFIGNRLTPKAKDVTEQTECVNSALVQFNPEIVQASKEAALPVLLQREVKDNEIAAQKGLKPYMLLNVEFNDVPSNQAGGYMGWYYVTLAVDGKIRAHLETGLNYDIADGKVSDTPTREDYFTAGALKETDVDYVFNNVGFSSTSDLYTLPLREDVRERAERKLEERRAAAKKRNADASYPIRETGETVRTPRGCFYVADMTVEQMEAAGYGVHHQSDDGKYLIMGNGRIAYAVPAQKREARND